MIYDKPSSDKLHWQRKRKNIHMLTLHFTVVVDVGFRRTMSLYKEFTSFNQGFAKWGS